MRPKQSAQEKYQHEILRELQKAVRLDEDAKQTLTQATLLENNTAENLHQARLALRRVVEGGI